MKGPGNFLREGERRQATILFADLSGFTSMSEKMDPEELTFLVNECLKVMGSCIEEHEGTIDKFIGDCVMATFGVPKSIENAPQKAINAAIEIRNQINQFRIQKKIQYPLDIHIGINTGMIIAGPVGSDEKKEFTVMGDAVNIASRLKDISTAGQIYIGPTTYRYVKEDFQFKSLEPVLVKGKNEPIKVFELQSKRERTELKSLPSNRMISSILVGRKREMDKLSLQLLKVINGEGSIVNIAGEAGIGKSRLIAELRQKEEMERITLIEGRAISSGQNLSFYPIIDLIKKWLKIQEEDTSQIIAVKLEKRIKSIARNDADEIYPFIATMMGLKLQGKHKERIKGIEGASLEKLMLKSLDELFICLASSKPLVIILEDLHWADLTSIEFLNSHFRLALENPILFINVFRPAYKETSDRIMKITQERYSPVTVNIKLNPLTEKDCEGMIHNLLKISGFPLQVKDQIINRTGGNPFFIEEIIRSFIDEGIIVVHNNRFELTGRIKSVEIPATINEVIMSRIDRLDEDSRSLLKTASVIGRSFYYKILTHLADADQELDERLAKMEEIQLLTKQKKNEEVAYLFKHALAQEATYQSILLKKRKDLHLQTAQAIERIFADRLSEFYGILAWHFSKGEDFKSAEKYLLKAGEEAMRTSASSEAINYFREALTLYRNQHGKTADWGKIANIEKNIGIALFNKGRFGEALPYFDSVLSNYGVSAKRNKIGTVIALISGLFHLLVALYIPSLKWRKIPSPKDNEINNLLKYQLGCTGFVDSGRMLFLSARFIKRMTSFDLSKCENGIEDFCLSTVFLSYAGISFALHRKLLDNIQKKVNQQNTVERMSYEFTRITNYRMEGNYSAYHYDNSLVEDAFRIGHLQNTSYYLIFSFFIELGQGNFSYAEQRIEKLAEMAKLFDNETVESWLFMAKSKIYSKQRKLNQALIEVEKFIEFCKKVDDKSQLLWAFATKAYIEFLMGDIEGAEQSMEHVTQTASTELLIVFKTTQILNELLIPIYHFEKAIKEHNELQKKIYGQKLKYILKAAKNIAPKIADDRIEIMKTIGLYYWLNGKQHRALKWWQKGIVEGERLNARPELARLYFEASKRMTIEKDKVLKLNGLNSEGLCKRAEEIFSQIDLEEDLREVEEFKIIQANSY